MEKIEQMSLTDKITLLNHIRKNYSDFSKFWTHNKVVWLEEIIDAEIKELSVWR